MDPETESDSSGKPDKTAAVLFYSADGRRGFLKCQVMKCRFSVPAVREGYIVPRKLFGSHDSHWHTLLFVSLTAFEHHCKQAMPMFPNVHQRPLYRIHCSLACGAFDGVQDWRCPLLSREAKAVLDLFQSTVYAGKQLAQSCIIFKRWSSSCISIPGPSSLQLHDNSTSF